MKKRAPTFLFICFMAPCWGCSRMVSVEGTVTLDGKPVEGASVLFVNDHALDMAMGTTDADGRFALKTKKSGDGILPGKYKVAVSKSKVEFKGPPASTEGTIESSDAARFTLQALLPPIYSSTDTSPLQFEVPKKGIKDLEIKLSSKPQ